MTKFVEVTQENTEELGFDWIVTPFSVSNDRAPSWAAARTTAPVPLPTALPSLPAA
ncbi:MAG: hypothetical protein ACLT8E_06120 [Akkermansia sp.]